MATFWRRKQFSPKGSLWFLNFEKSEKSELQKIPTWLAKTTFHFVIWDPTLKGLFPSVLPSQFSSMTVTYVYCFAYLLYIFNKLKILDPPRNFVVIVFWPPLLLLINFHKVPKFIKKEKQRSKWEKSTYQIKYFSQSFQVITKGVSRIKHCWNAYNMPDAHHFYHQMKQTVPIPRY